MDNEQPDKSHRGRARERQRRRKEREHGGHASLRLPSRQLKPAGSVKLPVIKLPANSRLPLFAAIGLVFVIAIIFVLGRLRNDEAPSAPNAIWIGTEWTYEDPTDDQVLALSRRLRDNQIGTVFAYVSWLKTDLTWAGVKEKTNTFTEVEPDVKHFVQQFKLVYPDSHLYAWISVPNNMLGIPARLDDTALQQAVAAFCSRMVTEFGFDGVHLNVEQVWDGDEGFLQLLRAVRAQLGIQGWISVAMSPDWSPTGVNFPVPPRIEPGTVWSKEYKQSVALIADQIAVMAYNTDLTSDNNNTPLHYSEWMAYQVFSFASAISELETPTRLLMGIPAYDAEPAHDPLIENIDSATAGIKMGLEQAGAAAQYVQGVAIYAEWAMDDSEWALFEKDWLER